MGICAKELRNLVIRPTLQHLGQYSAAAENLLLATAAQESGLGYHLQQNSGNHKGLGIYQIDEVLHREIWDKYLAFDANLASTVRGIASQRDFLKYPHAELTTNLAYSTAICWVIYLRAKVELPAQDDIEGLGHCWKHYYPTLQGDIDIVKFKMNFNTYIGARLNLAA